jgi:hypothetical protein
MAPSLRTHKYKTFLMKKASSMSFFVFYTPQQNEVAERKNRTLIEMIRIMLDEYKTFDHFWAEVVNTTCHANNRLYLHKLLKKTSHEFLTGKKTSVSYFRVFRSKYYVLQNKSKSSKFSTKVYVSCSVMIQTLTHIVFSTRTSVVLKSHLMWYLMRLMVSKRSKLILTL